MSVTFAQGFSAAGVAAGLVALVEDVVLLDELEAYLAGLQVPVGSPGAPLAAVSRNRLPPMACRPAGLMKSAVWMLPIT